MAVPDIISRLKGWLPTGPQPFEEPFQPHLERKNDYLGLLSTIYVNPCQCLRGSPKATPQLLQSAGRQKISQQLLDSLAELAEGTTLMGKPQRTERQYGVIGGHRATVISCPPVLINNSDGDLQETNQSSYLTSYQYNIPHAISLTSPYASEIIEPPPVSTKRIQGVEVRTCSSPLSAALAEFSATIISLDDENQALQNFIDERRTTFARRTGVPRSQTPPKREPLAVLYYDEEAAPSRLPVGVVKNKICFGVRIAGRCLGISHGSRIASPVPVAQFPQPKGWARLHLNAPPAINTAIANAPFADQ